MKLENKNVGFVITGSFCTFRKTIPQIKKIIENGGKVLPIMSNNAFHLDTKFGKAENFKKEIEELTENKIIQDIREVEPIGPKHLTDIMIVAPASR